MFPMTITISNPDQLNIVMAALMNPAARLKKAQAAVAQNTASNTPEVSLSRPADVAATETAPEPATLPPSGAEGVTQMPAAAAEKALHDHANRPADAPTYQDAAAAITKLSKVKGRDAAVAVLTAFGAAKLPDVKPEQFADIIAAAEKAGA
jgi:hypothetical protein